MLHAAGVSCMTALPAESHADREVLAVTTCRLCYGLAFQKC